MPKNTRKSKFRKNRRTSRPNVFAQSQPTEREDQDAEVAVTTTSTTTTAVEQSAPRMRARVERTTRIAGARSEIYTRSMPAELKKLGALAGMIVIALTVLTFTI